MCKSEVKQGIQQSSEWASLYIGSDTPEEVLQSYKAQSSGSKSRMEAKRSIELRESLNLDLGIGVKPISIDEVM
jgi:hypothetical protein